MKTLLSSLTLFGIIFLSGCQSLYSLKNTNTNPTNNSIQPSTTISLQQLEDKRWELAYVINPKGYQIDLSKWHTYGNKSTFDFDKNPNKNAFGYMTDKDDLVFFDFGCNGFSAGFKLVDNQLIIDDSITQTLVACGDTEDEMKNALKGVNILNYEQKNNRLTITTHNNYRFILDGNPKPKPTLPTIKDLKSYDWQLISAMQKPHHQSEVPVVILDIPIHQIEQRAKLTFTDNTMHYGIGCNQISRQFAMTKEGIETQESISSTKMAFGSLAEAEHTLNDLMKGSHQLRIFKGTESGTSLTQITSDNNTLIWQGTLKPEVKYGQGETVFFEVKPTTKTCDNLTSKQCLEVRNVNFNSDGIKTSTGQWQILYEPIEGYDHPKNLKQIIKVKRYRTQPTNTMGYGTAYVFENLVETQAQMQ